MTRVHIFRVALALVAVLGIFVMIDHRGGWTLFWAELKRKWMRKK